MGLRASPLSLRQASPRGTWPTPHTTAQAELSAGSLHCLLSHCQLWSPRPAGSTCPLTWIPNPNLLDSPPQDWCWVCKCAPPNPRGLLVRGALWQGTGRQDHCLVRGPWARVCPFSHVRTKQHRTGAGSQSVLLTTNLVCLVTPSSQTLGQAPGIVSDHVCTGSNQILSLPPRPCWHLQPGQS